MRSIWVRVRGRWQQLQIALGGSPEFRDDDLLGRLLKAPPPPPWRTEWDDLARYNAECSRGLVHTPEWQARMARLQRDFDEAHQHAVTAAGSPARPSRSSPPSPGGS